MRSKIDPRDLRVSMANEFRTRDARISREEERLHAAFVKIRSIPIAYTFVYTFAMNCTNGLSELFGNRTNISYEWDEDFYAVTSTRWSSVRK